MPRGYSPADELQRSEELYVFSALQHKEGLSIACHDDDPDFQIGSMLGIEVTRYHPDAGPAGSAHVATSRLRNEVLNRAAFRYQQAQPSEPIILSARWLDVDLARRNRGDLSAQVVGLARQITPTLAVRDDVKLGWDVLQRHQLEDVFDAVEIWRLPNGMANMWTH